MKFYLNNNIGNTYSINLDDSRFIYKNKEFDIAIIVINPKDKINAVISCLEIENNGDNIKSIESFSGAYKNKFVYIIQYPKGNNCEVSFGMMEIVGDNNEYHIKHKCNTTYGSSGSPIILLSNSKVIGIHLFAPKK